MPGSYAENFFALKGAFRTESPLTIVVAIWTQFDSGSMYVPFIAKFCH